jgi:GT2 family glycosyltransferase
MKSISVVIPNYNGKHLFEKYFENNLNILLSLGQKTQIIIVDDASTDDSVKYLKDHYPSGITIIEKENNTGFSETCNLGIQHATNELIFFLNTDVSLTEDYFLNLYQYFDLPDTFGVMGRIVGMEDDIIQEAARSPKISGRKIKPSNFFYIENPDSLTPTFYLSGAAALIDAEKLKILYGFNELFNPFYSEDQELSIRAWRLGWKCYYEHQAICRHEVSGSTKNHSAKRSVKKLYFRNRYYVHYLHLNGYDLMLWHFQVFFSDVIMGFFTMQGYKASAYFSVFKNRRNLRRKKRNFNILMKKYNSKISLLDVIHTIRKTIEGKEVIKL